MYYEHHHYTPEEFERVVNFFYASKDKTVPHICKELNMTFRVVEKYLNTHFNQKRRNKFVY